MKNVIQFFIPTRTTWIIFAGYVLVWAGWITCAFTPAGSFSGILAVWGFIGTMMLQVTFLGPFFILWDFLGLNVGKCGYSDLIVFMPNAAGWGLITLVNAVFYYVLALLASKIVRRIVSR
ncbi:MAG: hypothetical protein Q8Q08_03470 [Candidatus Omnitrophota bacterium]|nr:hypothetical protein [Candidatus Omnitrophota bacterium]MDZ4243219.1 hypothetical protein [Candidatus Omnitrophota bacterium]